MFRNINVDYDFRLGIYKKLVSLGDSSKRVFKFSIENDKLIHKKIIYDENSEKLQRD